MQSVDSYAESRKFVCQDVFNNCDCGIGPEVSWTEALCDLIDTFRPSSGAKYVQTSRLLIPGK